MHRSEIKITTERLTFNCRVQGDPDGLPMLLVHGNFGTSRWWQPFLDILPSEVRAYAPDLRGSGKSDKPAGGYEIENQALDLAALVDALGLDDFDLVAHGSGAAVALEYALADDLKLHSLVLVDPAPIEGVITPLEAIMLLEQMRDDVDLLRRAIAALMPTFVDPTDKGTSQSEFLDELVADAARMAPAAFTATTESLARWNRFREAGSLRLPTLIIWGDLDTIVERDAVTRTLIAIPGAANLEVLRDVGHSPMIEAPATLAERIIDFITDDFDEYDEARSMGEDHESLL